MMPPKDILRYISVFEHTKESSSWMELEWLLDKLMLVWNVTYSVGSGLMEGFIRVVVIVWSLDGCGWENFLSNFLN